MNITALHTALLADAMPIGERLMYGLQVFIIGYVTVFAVLTVLLGVLMLFRLFAYEIPNRKKKKAQSEPAEAVAEMPEAMPDDDSSEADDDTQLIAVITAAIEAYSAQSGSALPFRVVSYKRVRSAGGWQGAENNESF